MQLSENEVILVFLGFMLPFLAGYINNYLFRDSRINGLKDTRRAIKNAIEDQKVLPLISYIFLMICSKIDFMINPDLESELEGIIYTRENWRKLDDQIIQLERVVTLMAKVDLLYFNIVKFSNWIGHILLCLFLMSALGLIVYFFGNFILLSLWALLLIQTGISYVILKWKLHTTSSKFNELEEEYIR